jgi:hypothetical protein
MVEEYMLPASTHINRRLGNKEETTYRRDKEKKSQEKYKRANGYLKNTLNQKRQHKQLAAPSHLCFPRGEGKTT